MGIRWEEDGLRHGERGSGKREIDRKTNEEDAKRNKEKREREGGSKRCVDGAGCVMSEKTHQMTER